MLVSERTVSAQAHQATIATVRQVTDAQGQTVLVTNRYVELATGLHRKSIETGQWVRASDAVGEFDQGFVARQSAHQVIWPRTLDPAAVIDVRDAEGQRYRSRVLGLSWFDAASGRSALIAATRSAEGKLGATNTVLFVDAFDGVKADLAYVNRRDGLSQEVVLREGLPGPELWGLTPDSTRLEVITEFVEAPAFTKRERVVRSVAPEAERATWAAPDLVDAEVVFGAYRLGPGRAFALGEEDDLGAGTGVAKRWEELDGRRVLFEQVEWRQVKDEIGRLPRQARADGQADPVPRTASLTRQLPARPLAVAVDFKREDHPLRSSETLLAADNGPPIFFPGYVLDYELVTSQEDLTFKGDTTYYVSGSVTLTGTTTLEGAVVKFAPGSSGKLLVRGPFVDDTALYRPAIFTARDDDTVGAVISGSNGDVNSQPYYGLYHLYFQTASPVEVRHVRIKHAYYGLLFNGYYGEATHLVRHAQLIDCIRPMLAVGTTSKPITLKAQNVLIAEVKAGGCAFTGNAYSTVEGQHLTVANAPNLYAGFPPANFTLWNSLLVDVTVQDFMRRGEADNEEIAGETVFRNIGGGHYYLDWGYLSLLQTGLTQEIDPELLADLAMMTQIPPFEEGGSLGADQVWAPLGMGVGTAGPPWLGYHYPIVDHLVSGLAIQGHTLTLSDGVVVGVSPPSGILLESGGHLVSECDRLHFTHLVHQASVHEDSLGDATFISQEGTSGTARTVDLRRTELAIPADCGGHFSGGAATTQFALRECELYGGLISFRQAGVAARTVTFNNNVLTGLPYISLGTGSDANLSVEAYNNTFRWCTQLNLNAAPGTSWQWHDNIFDNCVFWLYYGSLVTSHNAYVGVWHEGSSWPLSNSSGSDQYLASLGYLEDWLGRDWYPANPDLADAGSRSAEAADLYFYTTDPSQAPDGQSPVGIGYHHVSVVRPMPVEVNDPSGKLDTPVSIGYHPVQSSLIVSVNFPYGTPKNFARIDGSGDVSDWSEAAGHEWQIEHMVVRDANWALPAGEVLFGGQFFTGGALWPSVRCISPAGVYDPGQEDAPWAIIIDPTDPQDQNRWPMGFAVDTTGLYGGDLLLTTSSGDLLSDYAEGGRVIAVDPQNPSNLSVIADVGHYMEGLLVLPDDSQRYGNDWAGCILTRGQQGSPPWETSGLLRIATNGSQTDHLLGVINPFDLALIPQNENLYSVVSVQPGSFSASPVLKVPAGLFANLGGDVLVMQSGEMKDSSGIRQSPELFVLHWEVSGSGTEVLVGHITEHPVEDGVYLEGICFAPTSLPVLP